MTALAHQSVRAPSLPLALTRRVCAAQGLIHHGDRFSFSHWGAGRIRVWLLLRPRTFQLIIGLCLLSYAVNLFIFSMGREGLAIAKEPVLHLGVPENLSNYADPLPRRWY